ncbi:hypothetical protein CEE37_02595 [candidate division LCP-89 bacterium B3_LCP]|uniref:M23ase beta-sheet core domain-containing protein n=1 Tax=candidate division LCP-89 bacterium B3_LCP TaxID=2012998 RepID=A0A532V2U5_UNCL8|nr:MAG: hypothetical protein CEE37_02595 [candidate division LCP-89 bacterium B3_LCP]
MLTRRFKLIYLSGGTSKKCEFDFSKRLFLLSFVAFTTAFFLLSVVVGGLLFNRHSAGQIASLEFKNSALDAKLNQADDRFEELQGKVELLAQNGNDLRLYTNLPVLDPEIQQMGIGGSLPYHESINTGAEGLLAKIEQLDRQINLQENSLQQVREEIEEQAEYLRTVPSIRPTNIGAFSSLYGRRRDPFTGQWEPHMGVDICAPTGTPVYCTADGTVLHTSRQPGFGKVLVVDHGNGYRTLYAHLHRFRSVKGQKVERGELIAELGNTGRSTGPHLHYEVLKDKRYQNPLDYMFDGYAMARLP